MLDAAQPWLPLLDLAPVAARLPRVARRPAPKVARRPVQAAGAMLALGLAPAVAPVQGPAPAPAGPTVAPAAPDAFSVAEARALRLAYVGLAARWDLSGPDALALMGEPQDAATACVERLRALVGVGRSLLLLHPERERARAFLRAPCPALGDEAPLGAMLAGGRPAIARVRAHLAALVNQ